MPAYRMRAHVLGFVTAAALLGSTFANSAHAGPSPLTLSITVDGSGFAPIVDPGVPNAFVGDNRIEYIGSFTVPNQFSVSWQFFGDVNPGQAFGGFEGVALSGDVTVQNLTGTAHDYEIDASVVLNALLANAMYGGSYSASLLSSTESGQINAPDMVLSALAGSSVYSAGINGGVAHSDFADPFSVSVAAGEADVIPTTNYGGVPGAPNIPTAGLITSLSHSLAFSLSGSAAGGPDDYDTVTFSMKIVVVPAPGALALLGMAGLVGRRRRRSV